MKRRGRADEALAAVSAPAFRSRLARAIQARGNVELTTVDIREMATPMLEPGVLEGVKVTFRWDRDRRRLGIFVKGATKPVDDQGARA